MAGRSVQMHAALERLEDQFERELMLERQREGIAKAKAEGKYKGRAPTARAKTPEIQRLRAEGIVPTELAKRLQIRRASVYRALDQAIRPSGTLDVDQSLFNPRDLHQHPTPYTNAF